MTTRSKFYRQCVPITAALFGALVLVLIIYLGENRDRIQPFSPGVLQCGCAGTPSSCGTQTNPALCAVCAAGQACVNQLCAAFP